jgi:hypothetical protein
MRASEINAALEKANDVVDTLVNLLAVMNSGQVTDTSFNVNEEFLLLYARENVNAAHAFLKKISPVKTFSFDVVTRKINPTP